MASKSTTTQIHEVYRIKNYHHETIHSGSMSKLDHSHEQIQSGFISVYIKRTIRTMNIQIGPPRHQCCIQVSCTIK